MEGTVRSRFEKIAPSAFSIRRALVLAVGLAALVLAVSAGRRTASRSAITSLGGRLTAAGSGAGSPSASNPPPASRRFFSASSVWNAPLATHAPLAADSARLSAALDSEVAREMTRQVGPWINTDKWSVPVYTVSRDAPRLHVKLDNYSSELQRDFDSVPIPAGAHPAADSDASLVIYQPSSNTLWEFWQARHELDGWHARWGGEITDVSARPGYYPNDFGGSGTSLSLAGGLIMISDLESGQINHAVAFSIPDTQRGAYSWPAHRSDGTTRGQTAIPEGTHFRIDPNVNLASLHMSPAGLMIARAVQRYGMIVRDTGGNVAFYAQAPTTGSDPYGQLFGGEYPNQVLRNFPWNHLEVVSPEAN
jgi:hypothetical protein